MRRAKAMFRPGSLASSLIALSIALSITLTSGEDNAPEHGSPARVAELLKELELPESTNLQRRRDAARELSQMHPLPPEAIAVLAKALDTFDRGGVQRYATIALAGAGAQAVPALAAQCNDLHGRKDGEGCQAAIGVLSTIAKTDPAAWPVLIDNLKRSFGAGAAIGLGKVGAPVVPLLRQALKDEQPKTRAMAAKALSDIGPPANDAIPNLLPLLKDPAGRASAEWPSPVVRYQAAIALANIDPTRKESMPVLIEILNGGNGMTKIAAIEAIQKMGSGAREAVPALEHLITAASANLNRSSALTALSKIEGVSAGPFLARVLKNDKDSTVRFNAARALSDLGAGCPETIPALVQALNDDRVAPASQLARLGKPGVLALMPALKSGDLDVRKEVVKSLSELELNTPWLLRRPDDGAEGARGDEQIKRLPDYLIDALMVAMADKSISIRELAARSLQHAGGEQERLALAEIAREETIYAEQSRPDKKPYTREQIIATIPPDDDNKYPLTLEYLFPIYQSIGVQEPEYLISLHRGRERGDRLVFWQRVGDDKYEEVKLMESDAFATTDGRFLPPKVFRSRVEGSESGGPNASREFVDVPQNGCNNWCVIDNVFAVGGDGDFTPVEIESPEDWYTSKLSPGESTWNSNGNSFSDYALSFGFVIWAGEDPHASPSAGGVTGTYKIIRQRGPWRMVVDRAERKPMARR